MPPTAEPIIDHFMINMKATDYDIILEWTKGKLDGTKPLEAGDTFWSREHYVFVCVRGTGTFICLMGKDRKPESLTRQVMTLDMLRGFITKDGYYEYDYCGHDPFGVKNTYTNFLDLCGK
jgi:hypothetical protein